MRHPRGSPAQPRQVGKHSILTGRKVQVATWPVFPKPRASSDGHNPALTPTPGCKVTSPHRTLRDLTEAGLPL